MPRRSRLRHLSLRSPHSRQRALPWLLPGASPCVAHRKVLYATRFFILLGTPGDRIPIGPDVCGALPKEEFTEKADVPASRPPCPSARTPLNLRSRIVYTRFVWCKGVREAFACSRREARCPDVHFRIGCLGGGVRVLTPPRLASCERAWRGQTSAGATGTRPLPTITIAAPPRGCDRHVIERDCGGEMVSQIGIVMRVAVEHVVSDPPFAGNGCSQMAPWRRERPPASAAGRGPAGSDRSR